MGGRPAYQQVAHLLCELLLRLQVTGHADASSYALPLTQEDLADMLGLSVVHVNRSLQKLKNSDLISLRLRRLTIRDVPALVKLAGFNPNYLHLRTGQRLWAGAPVERVRLSSPEFVA